jgi:hypothetical protein
VVGNVTEGPSKKTWWSQGTDGSWRQWNPVTADWEPAAGPPPPETLAQPAPVERDPWKEAQEGTGLKDYLRSGAFTRSLTRPVRAAAQPATALGFGALFESLKDPTLAMLGFGSVITGALGALMLLAWWIGGWLGGEPASILGPGIRDEWRNSWWMLFTWMALLAMSFRMQLAARDRRRAARAAVKAQVTEAARRRARGQGPAAPPDPGTGAGPGEFTGQ